MTERRIGQLGWSDGVVMKRGADRGARLQKISGLLDWSAFERLLGGFYVSRRGEAAYPALMMFKVLLLQRWYDLSDPEMEEALWDRLSFRHCARQRAAQDHRVPNRHSTARPRKPEYRHMHSPAWVPNRMGRHTAA